MFVSQRGILNRKKDFDIDILIYIIQINYENSISSYLFT